MFVAINTINPKMSIARKPQINLNAVVSNMKLL